MSTDRMLNDLEAVLLKALNERGLDSKTFERCKELLMEIIAKVRDVRDKGGDREDIKKAVYDLLNKRAETIVET